MKAKFLAFAALVLGLASCQNEPEGINAIGSDEVSVVLNVTVPEDITRAGGADSAKGAIGNIDLANDYDIRFILEVYDASGALAKERFTNYENTATSTAFDLRLVPGRDYKFVVWADFVRQMARTEGENYDLHYVTTNQGGLKNITVNAATWKAMDESRDAYTGYHDAVEFNSTHTINIELKRPFAKLRVVTTDMKDLYNVVPEDVTVTYNTNKLYTTFNAYTSKAVADNAVANLAHEFELSASEYSDAEGTKTLFADYMFGAENGTVKFTMDVVDTNGGVIPTIVFNTDIPVERNYLTTIIGPVLTDSGNVKVTINDAFENGTNWNPEDDKYDVEIWDGKTLTAPKYNATDDVYEIGAGSQLAWLAAAVSGTLDDTRAATPADSFKGKTFRLTSDINLGGNEWTPIGTNSAPFNGTFDGQNFKIANLVITGSKSDVGLFGRTNDGEIKNLVVENAKVSGRLDVAVVAGNPYTTKYTNITVQGHVEVNGMAYVGGVGGKNAYANWTNITVNVDETSFVNANSIEGGVAYRTYVGGVCGFNGEGGHSFTNISSNIDVKGSTIDVGGLFGIAHYGNKFENCSCSGDVEIYAAEEAVEAQEIGGIAGVWHNQNDTTVTMTNCTFTGKLKANIADVDFYYGGLVGKPYSETGTGILWLNGNKCLANGIIEDENGNLVVNSLDSLEEALTTAGAAGAGDTTIVFAENTNINMTNAEWTPIKVDGYHGADIVTIEGNGAVITGLKAPLFAGGFAGGSGIVIKNLTIKDSDIVSANTLGSGAFIESVDSMAKIELTNCHLLNSTVTGGAGSRTGGLIGWTAGYNNVNDGPVKTYVTIDNCSVVGCTIQCDGSVGGINGHAGNNAWTFTTISNCTIKNNNLISTDDGEWRTGVVVGTANVGEVTISNIDESGNTLTQTGKTAPDGFKRNYYGRAVLGSTGKLVIDGYTYVAEGQFEDANGNAVVGNQTALESAIGSGATNVTLTAGSYTMPKPDLRGKTLTITGTKDVVIDATAVDTRDQFVTGANIAFEGVTINFGKTNYMGFANAASLTYKNCVINGLQFLYGPVATFENCELNSNGAEHCVWTYGCKEINFTECDFTYGDRGINCYKDQDIDGGKQVVNFTHCTFATDNAASKGAVEINSSAFSIGIEVNLDGCTAPAYGELAYVSGWDSTNGAKTTINIK